MDSVTTEAQARPRVGRAAIASWLTFDWATQPFFTIVTTFVFGPFFVAHVAANPVEGQALWGYSLSAAGLIIALMSPPLGAIADASGARKPWIAAFSLLLIGGSAALWWAEPGVDGAIMIALVAFAIATIGAEFATVFTNAMMPDLVDRGRLGRLSGTGWAVGYIGGLVGLAIVLGLMVGSPETGKTLFGMDPILGLDPSRFGGDRGSGPFSALWYLIFALPLFFFVPDLPQRMAIGTAVRVGLRDLKGTLMQVRRDPNAARYLLSHMIYIDGLGALMAFGAIYASSTFEWSTIELGLFGIILLVVGIAGSLIGGSLDDRIGPKRVIALSLLILTLASIGFLSVDREHILFFVAVPPPTDGGGLFESVGEKAYLVFGILVGLVAGPLQAASRTLLVRVSPGGKITQYFGLYALSGKITSFAGPFAVGTLTALAGSQRIGISILLAFFIVGLMILVRVKQDP
ncbi:MFS transporter [Bauldia sp.]|uniref:MFS transporter n=1 Tax=Bauldia sp. TaxID=2575872 RepID=UPI003BABBF65